MLFKEVIGQESLSATVATSMESGQVAHARLFAGRTGYGTLALALASANYILCTEEKHGDACGSCPACKRVAKLLHPDLHFIFPVVKKKRDGAATVSDDYLPQWREMLQETPYFGIEEWIEKMGGEENAQPMIYTAESANILQKLYMKPFEADCRVVVIWLPERMNEECANKLLKILEEPYSGTYFILASEQPERLLPTILSRVQRINVPRLEDESLAAWLKERYSMEGDAAMRVARIAGGDVVKARQLVGESSEREANRERFISLMRLSWERQMVPVNRWVDEMVALGREAQKRFLAYSAEMIRENFMANFKRKELIYMTSEEEQFSVRFAPFVNEKNLIPLFDTFESASAAINRNGNARVILTDLCIKVMQNIRTKR